MADQDGAAASGAAQQNPLHGLAARPGGLIRRQPIIRGSPLLHHGEALTDGTAGRLPNRPDPALWISPTNTGLETQIGHGLSVRGRRRQAGRHQSQPDGMADQGTDHDSIGKRPGYRRCMGLNRCLTDRETPRPTARHATHRNPRMLKTGVLPQACTRITVLTDCLAGWDCSGCLGGNRRHSRDPELPDRC